MLPKKYLILLTFLLLMIVQGTATTNEKVADKTVINKVNSPSAKISLNFQDIPLWNLLQILAKTGGINIIVSDSVHNNITLHLENVTWQQALTIILQSQGLGKREFGQVLMIAPLSELAAQEKQQLQVSQQMQDLTNLTSQLIPIHYGKAADIANLLKSQGATLLSSRGSVSFDMRTNAIWIQDVPNRLAEVIKFIKQIDIPAQQILIEARIVYADSSFEKELGARFGITRSDHISGTLDGASKLTKNVTAADIPFNQRLNVDLPATGVGNPGGAASFGLALAKLGQGVLLDLELSAMESEGIGQIISRPRVITANQQSALIEAGEEIPYQQETSSGATNIAFKKAVLSLKVTPQITSNNQVTLALKVNQDKPGARQVLGVPTIDTREINTQVEVENNQTIVLGGIYEEANNNQIQRVPFLGSLPLVGSLFRHTEVNHEHKELLIFVTPRILATKTNP